MSQSLREPVAQLRFARPVPSGADVVHIGSRPLSRAQGEALTRAVSDLAAALAAASAGRDPALHASACRVQAMLAALPMADVAALGGAGPLAADCESTGHSLFR